MSEINNKKVFLPLKDEIKITNTEYINVLVNIQKNIIKNIKKDEEKK